MFIPFPDISTMENFIDVLTKRLEENKKQIEALLSIKDKTYQNFIKPFEMIDERLDQFFTPLSHLNSVNNSDTTQKLYSDSLPILTNYSTDIGQDNRIYEAFKQIKETSYNQLTTAQKSVIDQSILGFELSGANLDDEKKARLKEINVRKSDLGNQFSQNVLDDTNAFELILDDKADVEGLPLSDIETAAFDDEGTTRYKFTLQMPSYIAYMTYGPNREVREKLYKAYVTRAPQNAQIIDELLSLKQEASKLLGFDSYAQRSLATKMASDPQKVIQFLTNLQQSSKKQGKQELAMLQAFAKEQGCEELQSHDAGFYAEQLRKRDYDIDEELYRPYFEQTQVVTGLFDFLEKLFGMRFVEVAEKLWDDKAKAYDIYVNNKLRARLLTDLEARKNKRGGAWMHNWQTHCTDEDNKAHLASAFIVCNFPASSDTTRSLLRHDDVVTLFHEMGHAIHHLMSEVDENSVSGVNGIEWDAVEFPSQFLENFAYAPQVLKMFAKHHETGEILNDEMIDKLVKAKNFQSAMTMLRQLEFGLFDFKLHMNLYQGNEVQELLDTIRKENNLIMPPSFNKFQNSFSHIFAGGYSAGYYSYKWAEVLSADAYYYFVDHDIFDEKVANAYRDVILGEGASESMEILFEKFRGQELNTNA
ncbi:MAG: M3 family metallopeptidase, partial [Thiovulaceae bacterium]|nr:M3 family metallopeptidase [Sulfurimonadaceae bacterium]